MKMNKRILMIFFLIVSVFSFSEPFQTYAAVTGDMKSDPIILEQKQTKNTSFAKDGNVKYFKLIVKETGTITISFASSKLKKNAIVSLFYDEGGVFCDQMTAKYSKKTKTTTGTLRSSKLLMPGQNNIIVNTDTVSKDTKFTLKTTFKKYACDDIEPNNKEDLAQPMVVKSQKSVKKYQMILSGETNSVDMIDYFTFDLKSAKKIKVTASSQETDRIRVLIKKKTETGTEVINTKESEQYFVSQKSKNTFSYTTKKALSKGTYYIMVWLEDGQNMQVPYTIQASTVN